MLDSQELLGLASGLILGYTRQYASSYDKVTVGEIISGVEKIASMMSTRPSESSPEREENRRTGRYSSSTEERANNDSVPPVHRRSGRYSPPTEERASSSNDDSVPPVHRHTKRYSPPTEERASSSNDDSVPPVHRRSGRYSPPTEERASPIKNNDVATSHLSIVSGKVLSPSIPNGTVFVYENGTLTTANRDIMITIRDDYTCSSTIKTNDISIVKNRGSAGTVDYTLYRDGSKIIDVSTSNGSDIIMNV